MILLAWASLLWMTLEGFLGFVAGVGAHSIALIAWSLGSVIEGVASVIVIWRFTGSRRQSAPSERTAQRAVAVSFWLLAPYIAVEAVHALVTRARPDASVLGAVITASSIIVMPVLGVGKRRLGNQLHSNATAGEGTQNLLCAAQAAALLVGLSANALFGAAWLDPVIALFLAGWALREGRKAWRGEDCC